MGGAPHYDEHSTSDAPLTKSDHILQQLAALQQDILYIKTHLHQQPVSTQAHHVNTKTSVDAATQTNLQVFDLAEDDKDTDNELPDCAQSSQRRSARAATRWQRKPTASPAQAELAPSAKSSVMGKPTPAVEPSTLVVPHSAQELSTAEPAGKVAPAETKPTPAPKDTAPPMESSAEGKLTPTTGPSTQFVVPHSAQELPTAEPAVKRESVETEPTTAPKDLAPPEESSSEGKPIPSSEASPPWPGEVERHDKQESAPRSTLEPTIFDISDPTIEPNSGNACEENDTTDHSVEPVKLATCNEDVN